MSGNRSRNKGSRSEREFFRILSDNLNISVNRNLQQTHNGGADTYDVPRWAIEVKNQKSLDLHSWWVQACMQVTPGNPMPALAFKQFRKPWTVMVGIDVFFGGDGCNDFDYTCCLTVGSFVRLVRRQHLASKLRDD